jgi:type II secretory pathway component GspD/PulD (secretin)
VDEATRVMIYSATQRSHKYALQYFERLRKNTALIVFETNIWEVTLDNENRNGINWNALFSRMGNFSINAVLPGGSGSAITTGPGAPVAITPSYANGSGSVTSQMVLDFISTRGNVKTISQPQITVLSGSKASFSVQQKQNFIKSTTTTPCSPTPCTPTVTPNTDTVTTGLQMNVTSAWDQSTVYGDLNITLDELLQLQNFGGVQLPQTTNRSLQTQIRVRPGDAVLIGGLVSEKADFNDSGPGFMTPLFATSHAATKKNTELVFLLRPRVVAFDMGDDSDTPAIVDAPKEGMAQRGTPAPPLGDSAKGMFGKSVPNISNVVKDIFGSGSQSQPQPVLSSPSSTDPVPLSDSSPLPGSELEKKGTGGNP